MLRKLGERLRRHAGAFVVDGFFRGAAAAARLHPSARPEKHGLEVVRDVPYQDGGLPEHLLDVYRPLAPAPGGALRPAVLYVHGGGFRILSKDTHWVMGLAFAREGYVVFNISYRLAPRHPFPAAVADACAAYAWVVRHAAEHGADASRLALAGESAGANLVTALAVAACWRRPEPFARQVWDTGVVPRAVLPACGMLQVSDPGRFSRRRRISAFVADRMAEVTDAYLRGAEGADGASAAWPGASSSGPVPEASPASAPASALDLADPLVTLQRATQPPERPLPPFFAAVGTRDPLLDDTRRLKVAVERLGGECEARYYEGEPHAFHAFVMRANARRCWRDHYAFLGRHLPAPRPAR